MKGLTVRSGALAAIVAVAATTAGMRWSDAKTFAPASTISKEARELFASRFTRGARDAFRAPDPTSGYDAVRRRHIEQIAAPPRILPELARSYPADVVRSAIGGVPILRIRPAGPRNAGKTIIHLHGGGYIFGTAASTLSISMPLATAATAEVISIDYTAAPHKRWRGINDEIHAVVTALIAEGRALSDIAFAGDSAGGALAAAVVLRLRDEGRPLPAALVVMSPWSDITETGDTYSTLKDHDPLFLYERVLKQAAAAYADPSDHRHPWVSPVYADFSKGFPPTLIQAGTREIFLSNAVRLYRAIDSAGGKAVLDVYEGMPHAFQMYYSLPEAKTAIAKAGKFIQKAFHK